MGWRILHPHWHFEFWDDRRNRELIEQYLPQHAAAYSKMSGIKQADVSRVLALHTFGGVYADIDVEATQSWDDLLDAAAVAHAGILLGEENVVHTVLLERRLSAQLVSNAVMASAARHPFWLDVLNEIFVNTKTCGSDPVLCTGPWLIDRLSFDYMRANPTCGTAGCLVRLSFDYFSPHIAMWNTANMAKGCREIEAEPGNVEYESVLKSACRRFEQSVKYPDALRSERTFAVHHWQCSWCRSDTTLLATVALQEVIWHAGNQTATIMRELWFSQIFRVKRSNLSTLFLTL